MSKIEVIKCDGCGKILEEKSEIYHLCLETDRFWDGVEMNTNIVRLDFCYSCAKNIKKTLEKIAKSLEKKNK